MKLKYLIMLSLALFIASGIIILNNYNDTVIKAKKTNPLTIEKEELIECCQYYLNNEKKTCSILAGYNCDLCNSKCS